MLILRIRQGEIAVRSGRLDEAFEIARLESVRAHRKGQSLVNRLVSALMRRAAEHLDGSRPQQALLDCDKALTMSPNAPELLELRTRASEALLSRQRFERRQAMALATAREHIEQGRLNTGKQILDGLNGMESRAAVLMQDLNAKREKIGSAVHQAQAAIHHDDLDSAARHLIVARAATEEADPKVSELIDQAASLIRDKVAGAINDGRLDLADPLAGHLTRLQPGNVECESLRRGVDQCREAWDWLDRGHPARAMEILRRLTSVFPKACWINSAIKQLKIAEDALCELRTGPLGLLAVTRVRGDMPTEVPPEKKPEAVAVLASANPPPPPAPASIGLPGKFHLRVDGAGSFCVFRHGSVTIGSLSSSQIPDLGLIAEPNLPAATVERKDEDYFIRSPGTILVNDKPAQSKLLANNDRIALSPRCRLTFTRPNAASTTAVLDLSGARYPKSDVRKIILLDRDLVLGAGTAAHIRVEQATDNVVLHVRDTRLFVESRERVEVNGQPMDRTMGIPLGAHVRVGAVSFVVTKD